jgi:hypothetical protein
MGQHAEEEVLSPALPSGDWNGTRVTVVAAAYWSNVTDRWRELNAAADAAGWGGVRRVALLNSGEWYKLARNGATYPRSWQLYGMPLDAWTKVFLDETRAALRSLDAWRSAGGARADFFVSSVPCERGAHPECGGALRDGVAAAVADVRSGRVRFIDTAALADAAPEERRVRGHPSLLLTHVTWNLWFTLAFGGKPLAAAAAAAERCVAQRVTFDDSCTAAAMMARLPDADTISWEWLQQAPCGYSVRREMRPRE